MTGLQDKVALVTGGSRGLGAAIVARLAREGARVVFTYAQSADKAEDVVQAVRTAGGQAMAIRADQADVGEVRRAVAETAATHRSIDILVNNAAVEITGVVDDYALDKLDLVLAVNVRSTVVAIQETLRHMGRGGRIINIGSVSSDYMPMPGHAIYAMTKGAIAGLTRGLVRDLGPRGITVNNVQPGRVDTDMLRSALGSHSDAALASVPLRRFGQPEEVAALVAFLASSEADFVNGVHLRVDGGTSV